MEFKDRLPGMIESFLFIVGDEGLTIKQLTSLTERKESEVTEAIDWLHMSYEERKESGIMLKQFGGAYRLVTKADFAEDIKRLLENPSPKSMTQASLEVLAIIAYRQPVTRVEIDDLRGVKSEGPINTLIAKGLIMEKGRSEGSGRAILFGTTDLFLDRFGLASLDGLPPLSQEEEGETVETDLFMTKFQEAFAMENDWRRKHFLKRAIIVVLFFTLLVGGGLKEVAASGQAWAVIDADTGRLLEGHNENVRLPIASLTKIWTAFTFIESGSSARRCHQFRHKLLQQKDRPFIYSKGWRLKQMPC